MMRRLTIVSGAAVMIGAAMLGLSVAAASEGSGADRPPVGPAIAQDTGAGELLLVVVGGVYPTRAEAEDTNAGLTFGDLQGFYVVPVAQFQGFREQIQGASPGDFALVSAFRTEAGADEFMQLAAAFGHEARVLPERVRSLGGLYAGLAQEAAPDGSGPLLGPVEDSLP